MRRLRAVAGRARAPGCAWRISAASGASKRSRGACPTSPTPASRTAVRFVLQGRRRSWAHSSGAVADDPRAMVAASSCWRSASTAPASSTIRATSISSSSSIPAQRRLREGVEPAIFFVRITQRLVGFCRSAPIDGYAFRVDLRLRPDPRRHPGRDLGARPRNLLREHGPELGTRRHDQGAALCRRPRPLARAFSTSLEPYVWRKYLDFAAIADVQSMKRQIHAVKGHDTIAVAGHDIKLGRGGIREIEFFVQTQQLVCRRPAIRRCAAAARSTCWPRLPAKAGSREAAADELSRGLSVPAPDRAPPADGR